MSDYNAPLFGPTSWPDTSDWDITARIVGAMYQIGAALDKADVLRAAKSAGETLTEKETLLLAKVDALLEEGLPFPQEPTK